VSARDRHVVGVDFGTRSARAVVVRVSDGEVLGGGESAYADGVLVERLPGGRPLPPDWALQNPADWLTALRTAVPAAVRDSGVDPASFVGLGTAFTSCTVLPTDVAGRPLARLPGFADRPHAWPKLWSHHAAQPQADRITALAQERGETWAARYGGKVSSEWQFPKALQVLDEDPELYAACARWVEAGDWIVEQLTGARTRNAAAAGYKGLFQDGRYPDAGFLAALDRRFADFAATRLSGELTPLGRAAGRLRAEAAGWTQLPEGIAIAAGHIDAHVTAPAAGVTEPGQLLVVLGTSTCHITVSDRLVEVPGMSGVVDGGVVAGRYGYEAGQSAVGDIFAWWAEHHVPAAYADEARRLGVSVHDHLSALGAARPVGAHGLLALDWMNGNRSVLVDHELSGVIVGLTLATRAEDVYRALQEATAFGTRRIVEAYLEGGLAVDEIVVAGGLLKNRPLMQLYADVLGRPLSEAAATQGPAVGAAIHGAVAAGEYPDVPTAAAAMGRRHPATHRPDPARHAAYGDLYRDYVRLHDALGRPESAGGNEVLHRLRARRNAAHPGLP
jgi:L-ribulokinase